MTAQRPIGTLATNPHGLWQPEEASHFQLVGPDGHPIDRAKWGPPYIVHEFVDWHGWLGRVYLQPWMTPEERSATIAKAEAVHGEHSAETCCVKQRERLAQGETIVFASKYLGPDYEPYDAIRDFDFATLTARVPKGGE